MVISRFWMFIDLLFLIVKSALSYKERKMGSVIKGLCYRSINRERSRPNIEISAIPSIIS